MSTEPYCDFGDLPVSQCACTKCRPDVRGPLIDGDLSVTPGRGALLDTPTFEPVGRLLEASFRSTCEGCEATIHPGSLIGRTSEGGYVCSGCAA